MTDDDFAPPSTSHVALSAGTGAGLAGLLIGCTLLVSACILMVFNVILFSLGMRGIPRDLAQLGGLIGAVGVAALGVFAVASGVRGWNAANRAGESNALGIAGTLAGAVGLVAWLIAAIDMLAIMGLFR